MVDELMRSQQILIAGQTTGTIRGNMNTHMGLARVVIEPRLSDATNGTTAWYLVANRMQARSIAILYLNGQRTPVVERADPPSEVLGLGWRMYHDVGAAAVDWRGINRSKGA